MGKDEAHWFDHIVAQQRKDQSPREVVSSEKLVNSQEV